MITKLKYTPISGKYEEIIFDFPGAWRKPNWNYVLFETNEMDEWCGAFRSEESKSFALSENKLKNIACIISGGHGFIININTKEKIKDIDSIMLDNIEFDENSESFIISTFWQIIRIDSDLKETLIDLPIEADGIHFTFKSENKLNIEIEEINSKHTKNNDYYLDLNDWKIKKHAA
jgi:hypothetical protein